MATDVFKSGNIVETTVIKVKQMFDGLALSFGQRKTVLETLLLEAKSQELLDAYMKDHHNIVEMSLTYDSDLLAPFDADFDSRLERALFAGFHFMSYRAHLYALIPCSLDGVEQKRRRPFRFHFRDGRWVIDSTPLDMS